MTPSTGLATESQPNTIKWAEEKLIEQAIGLMLRCTCFDNLLPNPVALTSQIDRLLGNVQKTISHAANIEPLVKSMKQVS